MRIPAGDVSLKSTHALKQHRVVHGAAVADGAATVYALYSCHAAAAKYLHVSVAAEAAADFTGRQ